MRTELCQTMGSTGSAALEDMRAGDRRETPEVTHTPKGMPLIVADGASARQRGSVTFTCFSYISFLGWAILSQLV